MPLSDDPTARQRQLANLRRGGRRAPPVAAMDALQLRLRRLTPTSPQVQAVIDELLAVQSELAKPTPADLPLLTALAMALVVERLALAELLRYGLTTEDGKERPAARLVLQAADTVGRLCDRLAIGPAARSKLGLGRPNPAEEFLKALADGAAPHPTVTAMPGGGPGGGET
ncbi:MAG: hypothetical protein AB1609_19565 [Bacillota bacterium]